MILLKQLPEIRPNFVKGKLQGLLAGLLLQSSASAATFVWDINSSTPGVQDGSGAWNTTNTNWYDLVSETNTIWENEGNHTVEFHAAGNPASTVTLSNFNFKVGGMTFTSVAAPDNSGNSHALAGTSTVTLAGGAIINTGTNVRANMGGNINLVAADGFTKTGAGVFIVQKFSGNIGDTDVQDGALDIYGTANFTKLSFTGTGRLISHSGTHIRAEQMIFDSSGNSAFAAPSIDASYTIGSGGLLLKKGSIYLTATTARVVVKLEGDVSFEGNDATSFVISSLGDAPANMKIIDLNNEIRKFNIESGKTLRIDPIIQNGTLHKKGAGTLDLRGANTYAGGTYIEEGRVLLNGAGVLGPASSTVTLESAGILDLGGTDQIIAQLEGSGVVQNTRSTLGTNTLTLFSDTKHSTFTGGLNDVGTNGKLAIVKDGSSTLSLSGLSTYSGGTTLKAGTLSLVDSTLYTEASNNYVRKTLGSGTVKLQGGTVHLRLNGTNTTTAQFLRYDNALSLEGDVVFDIGRESGTGTGKNIRFGNLVVAGNHTLTVQSANSYVLGLNTVTLNNHLTVNTVNSTGGLTIGSTITGANYDVNKYGAGNLVYNGGTFRDLNIYDGKVDFFNSSTVRNVNVYGTGYFTSHSGNTWNVDTLNYHSTSALNNFYAASGTSTFNFNVMNMSAGTMRWLSDSGSADTTVIKMVLKDQLNVTGNVSFLNEGGGLAQKIFDLNNGQRTISVSEGATLNNNIRIDNGSFIKVGGGTMIVGAASTYTGGTQVQAGTLEVNNSTGSGTGSGNVHVSSATLSGIGILAPTAGNKVILGSKSVLSPGRTTQILSTLTIDGDAEFLAGASVAENALLSLQIGGKIVGQYDRLFITGDLNFEGNVKVAFANAFSGSQLAEGDQFDFLDWGSATFGGSNQVAFFDLPDLSAFGLGWNTSQFTSSGVLSVMAIPEPKRALLFLFGTALISMLNRKRKAA